LINIKPKKILVIRNDLRGDLIATTPGLIDLKKTFSSITVDLLVKTNSSMIVENCDFFDTLLVYSDRKNGIFNYLYSKIITTYKVFIGNYDVIICPRSIYPKNAEFFLRISNAKYKIGTNNEKKNIFNIHIPRRKDIHESLNVYRYLKPLGVMNTNQVPKINPNLCIPSPPNNCIHLHISSDRKANQYNFEILDRFIKNHNKKYIITFAPQDIEKALKLNKNNNVIKIVTGVRESICVAKSSLFTICPDGGMVHFAWALNKKIIGLFPSKQMFDQWCPKESKFFSCYSTTGRVSDINLSELESKIEIMIKSF